MPLSIGIDIVSLERFRASVGNGRFLNRVFTRSELGYSSKKRNPHRHLAGRFAAKEAFLKALRTGFSKGIRWKDIEVLNGAAGEPLIKAHSRAKGLLKGRRPFVSISYSREVAAAFVAIE